MKKRYKARKVVMIAFFGILAIGLFTFLVMSLWNAILPGVINVSPISFWQALGILVLSKILFGGFRGGGGWSGRSGRWNQEMKSKWSAMTPEEREKFKQQWRSRCGWRKDSGMEPASETNIPEQQ